MRKYFGTSYAISPKNLSFLGKNGYMLKNVQQLFLGIAEVQLVAGIELFYGCVPVWLVL